MTLPPIAINVCMLAASFRLLDKHGMTNEQPQNSVSCVLYHYFLFFIEFWHENFGGLIFGPGIFLGFRLFTPIWLSLSLYCLQFNSSIVWGKQYL